MRHARHLIFASLLGLAAPAASLTVTTAPGAPDPGVGPLERLVVSFDDANAPGYVWTAGQFATRIGHASGVAAPPSGNASRFGYVSRNLAPGFATLSTPRLRTISFYWGSIDGFNSIDVFGDGGALLATVSGGMLPPATGNQIISATNRRVYFTTTPDTRITALTFRSTGVAFEFDDISALAVPEPASWAMLIAGFGLIGASLRRRRTRAAQPALQF